MAKKARGSTAHVCWFCGARRFIPNGAPVYGRSFYDAHRFICGACRNSSSTIAHRDGDWKRVVQG